MSTRQTLSLHIGQAGVQLGSALWELLSIEHGIKVNGSMASQYKKFGNEKMVQSLFYNSDLKKGKYAPRCLLIDTESMVIDEIRSGSYRNFFPSTSLISGIEDSSCLFPKGYNTAGQNVLESTAEGLRSLCESSDNVHGMILYRSCCGGTGSGTTQLILEQIENEILKINLSEFIIIPSPCISTSVVEAYNTVLTLFKNHNHLNLSIILDNQALYDISTKNLNIQRSSYFNINRIISQVVSSITASLRYDSILSADFYIFQTNLVPYPELKYCITSYAPILPSSRRVNEPGSIQSLTEEVFQRKNFMVKCFPDCGEYMACVILYRGKNCSSYEINQALSNIKTKNSFKLIDWCPTGFKIGLIRQPPPFIQSSCLCKINRSVCVLSNSTCISQIFDYLIQKFDIIFKRKAYFHWFQEEGMEELELVEARQGFHGILMNYVNHVKQPQN